MRSRTTSARDEGVEEEAGFALRTRYCVNSFLPHSDGVM